VPPSAAGKFKKTQTAFRRNFKRLFQLLLKEKIEITGAGRTDSGVNAVQLHSPHGNLLFKNFFRKKPG
jgi:hypothetical protein